MIDQEARFACDWTRNLLPPPMIHSLVRRAVAQMPDTSEAVTLLEVAQRLSPQMYSALLQPPILGELFLAELLTLGQGSVTIHLPQPQGVSDHESDYCQGIESNELGED